MRLPDVDPIAFIVTAPPGTAAYATGGEPGAGGETYIIVRETPAVIRRLGPRAQVEVRAAVIHRGAVLLVPVMAKVGREPPYETWINGCDPGGVRALELLSEQDRLVVHFFDGAGSRPTRSIRVSNALGDFSRTALKAIRAATPWAMDMFDRARETVYAEAPTPGDLWRQLGRPPKQ